MPQRLSDYLKKEYGQKIYRLSLSSGCICPNRQEAAKRAILEARPKTVVMIIGKGSEAYAYRKGVYYPVPADTELARKYIQM